MILSFTLILIVLAIGALAAALRLRKRSAESKTEPAAVDIKWVSPISEKFPVVRPFDANPENRIGLQGNLLQTPLHDLLQYLSLGRKSGVLDLVSGRRTAVLTLREGRIHKALFRGQEGAEAIYLMLELPDGDFEFSEGTDFKEEQTDVPMEVVDILMLWMARTAKKKKAI